MQWICSASVAIKWLSRQIKCHSVIFSPFTTSVISHFKKLCRISGHGLQCCQTLIFSMFYFPHHYHATLCSSFSRNIQSTTGCRGAESWEITSEGNNVLASLWAMPKKLPIPHFRLTPRATHTHTLTYSLVPRA